MVQGQLLREGSTEAGSHGRHKLTDIQMEIITVHFISYGNGTEGCKQGSCDA